MCLFYWNKINNVLFIVFLIVLHNINSNFLIYCFENFHFLFKHNFSLNSCSKILDCFNHKLEHYKNKVFFSEKKYIINTLNFQWTLISYIYIYAFFSFLNFYSLIMRLTPVDNSQYTMNYFLKGRLRGPIEPIRLSKVG